MNIPAEIIEKAADGGWKISILHRERGTRYEVDERVVLDATFWQSLGKSLTWAEKTLVYEDDDMEDGTNDVWQTTWLFNAHRFYDLVLEHKPTDEFWQQLLAANIPKV